MMRTHYISEAISQKDKEVTLAGWVHEVRNLGKMNFMLLRDRTGILQVFGKDGMVPPDVLAKMNQPKETVVCVTGKVVSSKVAKSGVELIPSKIEILGELTGKVPFEVTGKVPAELDVRLDY
ncbi:MAG TPA: OB-fold nucleic acid binding domain-containing protein, partial [Candidatus Micrarchaeota archaeon]|nr:OB-fold nucleic acid binding domain-containing protein [Candidatus Micrarchaeota archaeon]